VAFRKPLLLPATVTFGAATDAGGTTQFAVRDARHGATHLVGTVVPAPAPTTSATQTTTSGRTSA